jgi:hypothetical protein
MNMRSSEVLFPSASKMSLWGINKSNNLDMQVSMSIAMGKIMPLSENRCKICSLIWTKRIVVAIKLPQLTLLNVERMWA